MKRSIIDTFFQHVLLSRKTKIAKLTADLAIEYRNREPVQTLKLEAGREVLATSERLVKENPKIKLSDLEAGIRKEMEFFGTADRRSPLTGCIIERFRNHQDQERALLNDLARAEGVLREYSGDSPRLKEVRDYLGEKGVTIEEAEARQGQPLIDIPNDGTRIEGIEPGNVGAVPGTIQPGVEDTGRWHGDPTKTTIGNYSSEDISKILKGDFDYKWYERYARIGPFVVVDTDGNPITREQLEQRGWVIPPEERKEDGQPTT